MKIILFTLLILFFACDNPSDGDEENGDNSPKVIKTFDAISVEFGSADQVFNLATYISDEDGDEITFTASSSNQTAVSVTLVGTNLTVSFGESGSAIITISASANGKSVSATFNVTVQAKSDTAPVVANALNDISVTLNHSDTTISLLNVFSDADGDSFTYSVSSGNNNFVTGSVSEDRLILSFVPGVFGLVDITITALANGVSANDTFTVTIVDNSSSILNDAETQFDSENYEESVTFFETLITHQNLEVKAKAYVGLGFSLLRLENLDDAYSTFSTGNGLAQNISVNDMKSGLCVMEYSLNDDFTKTITLAKEILASDSNFEMTYDSRMNHKDIRLVLAQSYFAINDYEKSLTEVQLLGKLANSAATDSDLETQLLSALRDLADELN